MNETTFSLEDMFLLLFCLIDDLYEQVVPDAVRLRPGHERIQFSDSEVLTLSVMQEALSNDSERSFYRFVRGNYLHLFPRLLTRGRLHRRRKALWAVQELLLFHLGRRLAGGAQWLVVDSAPVETVKFARSQSGRRSIPEGEYGYIPSEKRVFFGLRLHALVSERGALASFALTPANTPERDVAEAMLSAEEFPAHLAGAAILADNGYSGASFAEAVGQSGGHAVMASPKQSRAPRSKPEARVRRWLRAKRDLIESVFNVLASQFSLETTLARSFWGVASRMTAKLLAFNLSIYVNRLLGRPDLAIKSLYL